MYNISENVWYHTFVININLNQKHLLFAEYTVKGKGSNRIAWGA
jgi:hypothetical protein